jgi:hypothetical protein
MTEHIAHNEEPYLVYLKSQQERLNILDTDAPDPIVLRWLSPEEAEAAPLVRFCPVIEGSVEEIESESNVINEFGDNITNGN